MPKNLLTDLTCKICNYNASNTLNLTNHIKKHHDLNNIQYTVEY